MLSYTDLKKGIFFIINGEPYEVLESKFSRMQQRQAVIQAKIRNLNSGKTFDRSFQPSDNFEEANIEKRQLLFLYGHRGAYMFASSQAKNVRFPVDENILKDQIKWLKPNTEVTALFFGEELIGLTLPIKVDLKVVEAAPGVQGDRAQGGTKPATLETGAVIQVPLFINQDDIVRVNTQTGEYAERAEKA